ncbi:MAG: hypothetical protein AB8H47_07805 [Bacteroidia bacterium]
MPQLPLYRFFQALRKANFALGVSDYGLLLDALNGGFGLRDEADLLRLCRTLWFKPGQSWEVFQEQFYQALDEARKSLEDSRIDAPKAIIQDDSGPKPEEVSSPTLDTVGDIDDQGQFDSRESQDIDTSESQTEAGEFVHLSIASSAELAGDSLQGIEEVQSQVLQQSFLFQGRYQAISPRQLTQSWRYLPDRTLPRPSESIDINKTVDQIAKSGRLEHLVYETQQVGIARLLILLDYEGSMVAFHDLAEQIAASAPKSDTKTPNTLYFHDVPGPILFQDPDQTKAYQISELAPYFRHRKASILIISDAGAARGRYDRQRIIQTQSAIKQLQLLGQHIAWLNPVPRNRWQGTSAEFIDKLLVPMFEINSLGMQQAVNALRGKTKPKL